jgi:hypothetical protein
MADGTRYNSAAAAAEATLSVNGIQDLQRVQGEV